MGRTGAISLAVSALLAQALPGLAQAIPADGSVLPFPPTPSAGVAVASLADSTHVRRVEPRRLPADVPNILIILLDDVGFGVPETFGGEIRTPTFARLAERGHQLQRLSHNLDLLADPRRTAHRAQPSPRSARARSPNGRSTGTATSA